ncbi:MAG: hypothetical protein F6J93_23650 [Oscillatoria sp. SIO1A7]|nr:hypothetical protein [Oscillatoria sp. SIO1A7]
MGHGALEVKSQKSKVKSQKSKVKVKSQKSKVKSQRSTVNRRLREAHAKSPLWAGYAPRERVKSGSVSSMHDLLP